MDLAESIGLTVVEARDAGGNPVLEEDEAVLSKFEAMQLILGSDADQGAGTLFITQGRLLWLSSDDPRRGYAVDFPAITMHAIATDPESVHRPCMYLQLDQEVSDDGGSGGEDEDGSPARPLPELRLVPADPAALDLLFAALCAGAERNPDGDAEEGQGSLFFDQDEALAGAAGAALRMSGDDVGDLVGGDPGRFDDPDDGGEDKYEEDEEAEAGTPQNGDAQ